MKSSASVVQVSCSKAQTQKLGARLGRYLKPGDIVLLMGNLGAGKTTLVQGLVKSLGVRETAMSPTFVLAQSFRAKIPVHHLDFYRLSEKEVLSIGVEDYLVGGGEVPRGLVLIEWANRCKGLWPDERLEVHMRVKPRSEDREIKIIAHGSRFTRLLTKFKT